MILSLVSVLLSIFRYTRRPWFRLICAVLVELLHDILDVIGVFRIDKDRQQYKNELDDALAQMEHVEKSRVTKI